MVMFYEEYSSDAFQKVIGMYLSANSSSNNDIGYWNYSNLQDSERNNQATEIVQMPSGQFPDVCMLGTSIV